jgi:hypothetical protein
MIHPYMKQAETTLGEAIDNKQTNLVRTLSERGEGEGSHTYSKVFFFGFLEDFERPINYNI